MVEKISVQIALEGGAEVQRQLEGIGEAGQKAFNEISKSAEQVGGFKNLKPEDVTAKLEELGVKGTAAFGKIQQAVSTAVKFEKIVTGIQSVEAGLAGLARAAGVVGAAVAAAFAAMVKPTIAFAEAMNKASDQAVKLGLSLEQFKTFQQNFEKFGVFGDAAASGFAKFRQELEKEAKADPKGQLAAFGLSADAALRQLDGFLQTLAQMPDGLDRTTLAISRLGEVAGIQFIQGLRRAEGSMSAQEAKAYDLGQAIERLASAWAKFGSLTIAPALTTAIDLITGAVNALNTAFASGNFSGFEEAVSNFLTKIGQQLDNALPKFLAAGQAMANAILDGFKQSLTPDSFESVLNAIIQDLAKFGEGILKNWEILKRKLSGGLISPAGAAEAGGAQLGGADFGPMIAGAEVAAASIKQIFADAFAPPTEVDFSSITTAAQTAIDSIKQIFADAAEQISQTFSGVDIASALSAQIDALIQKFNELAQAAAAASTAMTAAGGGGGSDVPGKAGGGLIGGVGSGTSDSNLAWLSRGEHVMPASVVRQPGVLGFLEAMRRRGGIPGYAEGGSVDAAGVSQIASKIGEWIDKISAAGNATVHAIEATEIELARVLESLGNIRLQLGDKLFPVLEEMAGIFNLLKQAGLARGGLLGGRGTGTSDSNLAWVSRGEFIMPASIVARPGMLDFLEMMRSGLMPRFATGGLAGGMSSHVTINFPGTPPISGLRASAGVVEQLQRAAALAQVRSGGRKPSRYS